MTDSEESISLFEGQLTTSLATLYTCPAGFEVDVRSVELVNITGTAATARIDRVPSGGTDGTTLEVVNESVAANATAVLPPGGESTLVTLMPGDVLTGDAGTATAIDCTIGGKIRRK
jgi:hypothetical protein